MNFDIDAIAADLTEDGDSYTTADTTQLEVDTWTFRLRIEPDDLGVGDIEDPEVFGRYEYGEYGRYGRDRPAGFTGAAVKIPSDSDQGGFYWYEPPMDFRRFKGSGFATIEEWEKAKELNLRYVRNLLSWGYIQIGIEVTNIRADGYRREWSQWFGGIESGTGLWGEELARHNDYVAATVKEQLGEVIAQIEQEVAA
jgi:hypothetical protein